MLSIYDFHADLKNVTFLHSLKRKQPYTKLPPPPSLISTLQTRDHAKGS